MKQGPGTRDWGLGTAVSLHSLFLRYHLFPGFPALHFPAPSLQPPAP